MIECTWLTVSLVLVATLIAGVYLGLIIKFGRRG